MKQLVIALTLTLAACAAVPNAPQDMANIPVPNAWQHASLSDKTIDNLPNRWWEAFDDKELNRLIDTALQQNSSLQKAALSLQQSLLQVDRQRRIYCRLCLQVQMPIAANLWTAIAKFLKVILLTQACLGSWIYSVSC